VSERLDPQDVELIAARVLTLLRADVEPSARLVDAKTLSELLGVTRAWVYAHAEQLHAVRIGGPQGRLRFDLSRVLAPSEQSAPRPGPRPKRAKALRQGTKLLPIDP
jgi:predicted DNA-binding transcriptional regulator AlpA